MMALLRLPLLALMLLTAFMTASQAQTPSPEEIEAIAQEVGQSLRCVVCQNQSIEDSGAPLAADMRRIVRERLAAGDTPDEVRQFMTDRYGNFVLMKPPLQLNTILLWFGPILVLAGALAAAFIYLRSGVETSSVSVSDLTAEEAALDAALAEEKDQTP